MKTLLIIVGIMFLITGLYFNLGSLYPFFILDKWELTSLHRLIFGISLWMTVATGLSGIDVV